MLNVNKMIIQVALQVAAEAREDGDLVTLCVARRVARNAAGIKAVPPVIATADHRGFVHVASTRRSASLAAVAMNNAYA